MDEELLFSRLLCIYKKMLQVVAVIKDEVRKAPKVIERGLKCDTANEEFEISVFFFFCVQTFILAFILNECCCTSFSKNYNIFPFVWYHCEISGWSEWYLIVNWKIKGIHERTIYASFSFNSSFSANGQGEMFSICKWTYFFAWIPMVPLDFGYDENWARYERFKVLGISFFLEMGPLKCFDCFEIYSVYVFQ
jgi:hypothetical protein